MANVCSDSIAEIGGKQTFVGEDKFTLLTETNTHLPPSQCPAGHEAGVGDSCEASAAAARAGWGLQCV
jgi:hypothetical protein